MDNTKAAPAFSLGLPRGVEALVKRAVGLDMVEALYHRVRTQQPPAASAGEFCGRVLRDLGIHYDWDAAKAAELTQLPGPVIFAANHPMGAIDALVLMALMDQTRPGARLMVNAAADFVPELKAGFLGVHIMKRDAAQQRHARNLGPLRACLRLLHAGGTLGIFPAGEVASFPSLRNRTVVEVPWNAHTGKLIASARATVVPVFIEGRGSNAFHYLGTAIPRLRLALLVRDMMTCTQHVRLHIGKPLPFASFAAAASPTQITDVVRRACFQDALA
ncbi:MAG: 1-acyl-sn-glycerol-3-phosphate acyltransferase [Myxococcales bacterium]|nr:1-acyl-sn-glycerol-3-phosphate acyltransferase [Myxococcales bacterium]